MVPTGISYGWGEMIRRVAAFDVGSVRCGGKGGKPKSPIAATVYLFYSLEVHYSIYGL